MTKKELLELKSNKVELYYMLIGFLISQRKLVEFKYELDKQKNLSVDMYIYYFTNDENNNLHDLILRAFSYADSRKGTDYWYDCSIKWELFLNNYNNKKYKQTDFDSIW